METNQLLSQFQQWIAAGRLLNVDVSSTHRIIQDRSQALFSSGQAAPTIVLAEADPLRFLVGWIVASAAGCPIVLGNPHWAKS
jgi:hypothetical protein